MQCMYTDIQISFVCSSSDHRIQQQQQHQQNQHQHQQQHQHQEHLNQQPPPVKPRLKIHRTLSTAKNTGPDYGYVTLQQRYM